MEFTSKQDIELFRSILDQAKKDFSEAMNYTYDLICEDLNNMYDSFIEDFYSYNTDMYIRHGEADAGTGVGHNLYQGKKIQKKTKFSPTLTIDFSSVDMSGGYKFDSASFVLDQVMGGVRFPATKKQKNWGYSTWSSQYYSPVANITFNGTMKQAFDAYDAKFDDIVRSIFYPIINKMGY